MAEARGLLTGNNLSEVQLLGLEYLRYADGVAQTQRAIRTEEHRAKLLETIVKGSLAASGQYEEKVLFREYFQDEDGSPYGESSGDAGTDFDYSDVSFGVPTESEMEVLARMLADDSVMVDGSVLEGPDAEQVYMEEPPEESRPSLPPPREFDIGDIEQDAEWV